MNYTVRHKNTPKVINHNLKVDHRISIIFGITICDIIAHQMVILVSTLPNICFCTTWGNQSRWNRR